MNANAWAALGMSVTDASKQASKQTWGLKKLPLFPVLKSVSHWLRASCFCQTCIHSSVFFARFPYPERKRFVLYFKFHCLRFIFSIIYSWKKKNSLWMFAGTSAERFFQMEHCLSMSWRSLPVLMEKISVARNMEKKKSCTLLAWTCFVFLLCILLFFVLSQYTVISQAKLKARAWMDLRGF